MLVYVNDIVVSSSSEEAVSALLLDLKMEFAIKDLGDHHYFLGIEVQRSKGELLLRQEWYAMSILERVSMESCKLLSTPISTTEKLSITEGDVLGA